MAATSQTLFSNFIFLYENCRVLIQILLMFALKCPNENKPALVQVMALHWTNTDPVHWRIYASVADK